MPIDMMMKYWYNLKHSMQIAEMYMIFKSNMTSIYIISCNIIVMYTVSNSQVIRMHTVFITNAYGFTIY